MESMCLGFLQILEFNFQEMNKGGVKSLPLEETLIVTLAWAGRERRIEKLGLETKVAELTSKLTDEVVVELTEEVASRVMCRYT